MKSLEYIKESLPDLGQLTIEIETPANTNSLEDLYKSNKIARRLSRRLKDDIHIILNDWSKPNPVQSSYHVVLTFYSLPK